MGEVAVFFCESYDLVLSAEHRGRRLVQPNQKEKTSTVGLCIYLGLQAASQPAQLEIVGLAGGIAASPGVNSEGRCKLAGSIAAFNSEGHSEV